MRYRSVQAPVGPHDQRLNAEFSQNIQSVRHISAAVPVLTRKCDRLQFLSGAILGGLLGTTLVEHQCDDHADEKSCIHSQRDSGEAQTQNEVGLERRHRDCSHDLGDEPQLDVHRVRISELVRRQRSAVQLSVLD